MVIIMIIHLMIMIKMILLIVSRHFQMSSQGGIMIDSDNYDHTFDDYDQDDLDAGELSFPNVFSRLYHN